MESGIAGYSVEKSTRGWFFTILRMGQGSRPAILLFLIIVFFVCFQVYTFFGVNRTFSKLLVVHGMKRDE